jgi:hypothetical protein
MRRLFDSLKESDRRRYAAIEAAKVGHGGIEYIAGVLGCDPKTIRLGLSSTDAVFEHRRLPSFPRIFGADLGVEADFLKGPSHPGLSRKSMSRGIHWESPKATSR